MATKIGKKIARTITDALLARDRAEMRAMGALLSLLESPRRRSRRPKSSRLNTRNRRRPSHG
jgi:hypothetical protein